MSLPKAAENLEETHRAVRVALIALGAVGVAVAAGADVLGIGEPDSFGSGQLILLLTGLAAIAAGLLGRRSALVYRGIALIFLNTIVLLLLLELAAIGLARAGLVPSPGAERLRSYRDVAYYRAQPWAVTYWEEAKRAERYRYAPYVTWRHAPFAGRTIHVDADGTRATGREPCIHAPTEYRVFALGGSSMWGWGSPDWETIPAHLQAGLDSLMTRKVCVVNLGEDGYISTQGVHALLLRLHLGDIPDAVVFYDGFNDIYAAYEAGRAGEHLQLESIASRLEGRRHPLIAWYQGSRQFSLAMRLVDGLSGRRGGHVTEAGDRSAGSGSPELAKAIADTYLSNHRLVTALGREYGFDHFFFVQPVLGVASKPLTPDERRILSTMDPELAELMRGSYDLLQGAAREHERLWYIADAFADVEQQIWIDGWGHVTPVGNRLVAEEMLLRIAHELQPAGGV